MGVSARLPWSRRPMKYEEFKAVWDQALRESWLPVLGPGTA